MNVPHHLPLDDHILTPMPAVRPPLLRRAHEPVVCRAPLDGDLVLEPVRPENRAHLVPFAIVVVGVARLAGAGGQQGVVAAPALAPGACRPTVHAERVHGVLVVVVVVVAAVVQVAADEADGDAHADREGLHEALEVGDRRRDERVRQHDLLQDEAPRDGELRLRGRQVRCEQLEVVDGEVDEGEAEGEGEEDLQLDVAGHVGRPDEGDREGADEDLGDGVDGCDGLPASVLSKWGGGGDNVSLSLNR